MAEVTLIVFIILQLMVYAAPVGLLIESFSLSVCLSPPQWLELIHPSVPLCRYGNSTKQYKVRVGDYHSLVPEEYEEEYAVDEIVLHPSYHHHSNDYDLALVRLSPGAMGQMPGECVSFSRHVLPACLPMKRERVLKQASNCHITGWGDTGEGTCVCVCSGVVFKCWS